jgi:hypothetical protein
VRSPVVKARVKQRHDLSALRINAGQVGSLVEIAPMAGESQILGTVAPTVLLRDDVFDVVF